MKKHSAFSLIELSIVVILVGLLIAAVTQGGKIVKQVKLKTARALTQSSPVNSAADLVVWYETSLESSFDSSSRIDGTAIATWYDNNPHTNDFNNATQSTSGYQPIFYENIFNGSIPAIRFDGTDDYMSFDLTNLINSDYSIFVVEQKRAASSDKYIVGDSSGVNYNYVAYYGDSQPGFGHAANHIYYTNSALAYASPVARMHTGIFSTTTGQQYWYNGGITADTSDSSSSAKTAITYTTSPRIGSGKNGGGSNVYFNGDIAEIIVFNRALRTEERQLIELYLSKKYAISII